MSKIRISAVSYTNSVPFVYGLENSGILSKIDLSLDIPSDCAQKLIEDKADIGLVPVAALLQIPGYQIVSNYCIGAKGAVDSVFLFSNVDINEIKTVKLDLQSRTSNNLARVLFKHHWKTAPLFSYEGNADAFVQIGDRTFGQKKKYKYVYDLAQVWFEFCGQPFVFAVWASNKGIAPEFVQEFDQALQFGLDQMEEVIKTIPPVESFDIGHYLRESVSYDLDNDKRAALNRFLSMVQDLDN